MAWYNWSKVSASNASADATINWAEGQAPSSVNDSARAMMARTAEFRDDTNGSLTTAGISTAYTLTTNQVFDTLAHLNGQVLTFALNVTSGAAPTLAVDGLAAKPIRQATGVALPASALLGTSVYSVSYNNSTGEFLIINPPQSVAASSLLGNSTGSPAAQSAVGIGGGLSFSGSTLIATLNPSQIQNYISGLTLSTAGSSSTFGIAIGAATDSTNTGMMVLASAYTKTTASWALGTANGALDTGSIANTTWYHVYLIERTDTNVVDILFSLSVSSPTLPTNYTLFRRIGSIRTDSSAHWVKFIQVGNEFLWDVPVADISNQNLPNSSTLETLTVPTGVTVLARFMTSFTCAVVGGAYVVHSPLVANQAVNTGFQSGSIQTATWTVGGLFGILTNTSAQVRAISNAAGTMNFYINTIGWLDNRGQQ